MLAYKQIRQNVMWMLSCLFKRNEVAKWEKIYTSFSSPFPIVIMMKQVAKIYSQISLANK